MLLFRQWEGHLKEFYHPKTGYSDYLMVIGMTTFLIMQFVESLRAQDVFEAKVDDSIEISPVITTKQYEIKK